MCPELLWVCWGWSQSLWSRHPTFPLTHLHQAGFPDLEEEVLVFFILLIINYSDLYSFAETEREENRVAEESIRKRQAMREGGEGRGDIVAKLRQTVP